MDIKSATTSHHPRSPVYLGCQEVHRRGPSLSGVGYYHPLDGWSARGDRLPHSVGSETDITSFCQQVRLHFLIDSRTFKFNAEGSDREHPATCDTVFQVNQTLFFSQQFGICSLIDMNRINREQNALNNTVFQGISLIYPLIGLSYLTCVRI